MIGFVSVDVPGPEGGGGGRAFIYRKRRRIIWRNRESSVRFFGAFPSGKYFPRVRGNVNKDPLPRGPRLAPDNEPVNDKTKLKSSRGRMRFGFYISAFQNSAFYFSFRRQGALGVDRRCAEIFRFHAIKRTRFSDNARPRTRRLRRGEFPATKNIKIYSVAESNAKRI